MVGSQLPKELKSALPRRKNSKDRGWKNLGVFKEPKGQCDWSMIRATGAEARDGGIAWSLRTLWVLVRRWDIVLNR